MCRAVCPTVAERHLTAPALGALGPGSPAGPGLEASITWADFTQALRDADRTGQCSHPVQLRGCIDAADLATGELRSMWDTTAEPGGALLVACGNRRESVYPACSAVYKRDARHLVRAGLLGGKGVPSRSPLIRACSPRSPPRASALFTHAACGAARCCRAVRDVITRCGCAHMAGISHARCATARMTLGLAGRCVRTATTMKPRCCSTCMPVTCGAGSPLT